MNSNDVQATSARCILTFADKVEGLRPEGRRASLQPSPEEFAAKRS